MNEPLLRRYYRKTTPISNVIILPDKKGILNVIISFTARNHMKYSWKMGYNILHIYIYWTKKKRTSISTGNLMVVKIAQRNCRCGLNRKFMVNHDVLSKSLYSILLCAAAVKCSKVNGRCEKLCTSCITLHRGMAQMVNSCLRDVIPSLLDYQALLHHVFGRWPDLAISGAHRRCWMANRTVSALARTVYGLPLGSPVWGGLRM